MARFYGEVGYGESVETPSGSGKWIDTITEFSYQGDVIRNTRQLENNDKLNDDISVSNSISIVADQYAVDHFFNIKYVRWAGVLWTVTLVEVRAPRLILTLGSVYNGPTPILVSPETPLFDAELGELTIADQDGIVYKNADTDTVINADGSPYLVVSGDSINVVAIPDVGYYFSTDETDEWTFVAD